MIVVPGVQDVAQYGGGQGPRGTGVPLIADDEQVCQVRVPGTGGGAYWSRGDVDVHVLYARRHGPSGAGDVAAGGAQWGWLAAALRERREARRRLLRSGVETTAAGLLLMRPRAQLILPTGT